MFVYLLACSVSEAPAQLEAFTASNSAALSDYDESAAVGFATVSQDERDWSLLMEDGATVLIHAAGGSDLAWLDGKDLDIFVGSAWGSDTRNVRIEDEAGIAFVAQDGDDYGVATDAFGAGFVQFADQVAKGKIEHEYGTFRAVYHAVTFVTEDGEVTVLPGEPFEASFGGADYRVVVHSAFVVTDTPDMLPGCGGGVHDTLSFEMQRVDDEASLDPVIALEGFRAPGVAECG